MNNATERSPYVRWMTYALFCVVLLTAAYFRFHLLDITPGWYPDEGTEIEIATNWLNGEQQYFSISQSTLVTGRLPLFHLVLASLFKVFGRDILVLRALTAGYGVIITALLFLLGREIWGDSVALLAAGLYAVYPNAVTYSRFGFIYNQFALLNLLTFYALWRYVRIEKNVWLVAACAFAGLSLVTGISALPIAIFVILVVWLKRLPSLLWVVPLLLLAPAAYFFFMSISAPDALLNDLRYLFLDRVGTGVLFKVLFSVWNYKEIISWDVWFLVAAFGLTRLPNRQSRLFSSGYFWYMLFATAASVPAITNLGFHYMIPMLPWVAVGVAAFCWWGFPRLMRALEEVFEVLRARTRCLCYGTKLAQFVAPTAKAFFVGIMLFWIFISPFAVMLVQQKLVPGLASPEVENVTVRDFENVDAVVEFINSRSLPDDVVLAPPQIGWLIDANVADFQQATAYQGGTTQNYPMDMAVQRFLFDCSPDNAKYAVLWTDWGNWASSKMPDVGDTISSVSNWPIVFQQADWYVYANPSKMKTRETKDSSN